MAKETRKPDDDNAYHDGESDAQEMRPPSMEYLKSCTPHQQKAYLHGVHGLPAGRDYGRVRPLGRGARAARASGAGRGAQKGARASGRDLPAPDVVRRGVDDPSRRAEVSEMSLFDTHDPKDIRAFYNLRDEIIERMRRNWKALETGLPVSEAELRFMSSCGLAENLVGRGSGLAGGRYRHSDPGRRRPICAVRRRSSQLLPRR